MARSHRIGKPRPSFLLHVMFVTISLGLAIFIKPHASLLLLQSFPNSSLWRERHLNTRRQGQPQKQQQDYYHILGVRRNANKDDIKTAFRQLVKQYHPDANPNTDTTSQFQTINKAYQTLSDPQRRKKYNAQLYHSGLSSDTPHFIIDGLEDGFEPQQFQPQSTATTDTVRYQPIQWASDDNGRGSLLQKDDTEEENGKDGRYRIRSY